MAGGIAMIQIAVETLTPITLMVRQVDETARLPPGYRLDLLGDPSVIVMRLKDGTVVARFTHNVDPEVIS
jgi:hypothetical protein